MEERRLRGAVKRRWCTSAFLALFVIAGPLISPSGPPEESPELQSIALTELSDGATTGAIAVDLRNNGIESNEVVYSGMRSAWWKYTPSSSYAITLTTAGWITNISHCVATAIGTCAFTAQASNGTYTYNLTGGTTYYFRLSSNGSNFGFFVVSRGTVTSDYVAPNDAFANATAISELSPGTESTVAHIDLTNATVESGEVATTGTAKTAWWSYTPSVTQVVNILTKGYPSNLNLSLCVTTTIGSCSIGTSTNGGILTYTLSAATTYYLRVNPNTAAMGSMLVSRAGNDNDQFANATDVAELAPGTRVSVAVNNDFATIEPGEVSVGFAKSRWWKYTPTANQIINITTSAVVGGPSHCVTIAMNNCSVGSLPSIGISAYALTGGTTYYIRISNFSFEHGGFTLARPSSDNDLFANATDIAELAAGASSTPITIDTTTSTIEPGEANPTQPRSKWWKYTPSVNQALNFTTTSVVSGNLALCITTAMNSCSVASVPALGRYAYNLTAATTYYIRASGNGTDIGHLTLQRPANDNDMFVNATAIAELSAGTKSAAYVADTATATIDPGEVAYMQPKSRWWSYTPTVSQVINLTIRGTSFAHCVTTVISTCSQGSNFTGNTAYPYSVTAGTTYYLRMSGRSVESAEFDLSRAATDNDLFANATPVPELVAGTATARMAVDLGNATVEPGEAVSSQPKSRWWSYAPTTNQVINISIEGEAMVGHCFTTSFASCTEGSGTNLVTYPYALTAGTVYYLRISSRVAERANITLLRQANGNDAFANAIPIGELAEGARTPVMAIDTSTATMEPSEVGAAPSRTRWWRYTATANQTLYLTTDGPGTIAHCVTTIITGCSVSSSLNNGTFSLTLTAGNTYYIRLAGRSSHVGEFLLSRGSLNDPFVAPNDAFANATPITEPAAGARASVDVNVTNATVETGEVTHGGAKSAWWSYTPSTTHWANVIVRGSRGTVALCITESFASCSVSAVGSPSTTVNTFTAGTTYYFRLSSNGGTLGTLEVARGGAGNDDMANATVVPELTAGTNTGALPVDVTYATAEPSETAYGGSRSTWYSYTPTSSYTLNILPAGEGGLPLSRCFTTVIGSCTIGASTSNTNFGHSVTAGTTYYLRISPSNVATGTVTFSRGGVGNDDFAGAAVIPELAAGTNTGAIAVDLHDATHEEGEVLYRGTRSKWWKYTPTATQIVNVATSSTEAIAVCLTTEIGSCSVGSTFSTTPIVFTVTAGTTYYLRLSPSSAYSGTFKVYRGGAGNDDFTAATPIAELAPGANTGSIPVELSQSTWEPGEWTVGFQSRWWSYTPTTTQSLNVTAFNYADAIHICITTAIGSCTEVGSGGNTTFARTFTAGTTYYFRLAIDRGAGIFRLARSGLNNDNFAAATPIAELPAGDQVSAIPVDFTNATIETGETAFGSPRSLWWSYTPTVNHDLNLWTAGFGNNVRYCITTVIGSCSISTATGLAAVNVTAGTTYYLRLSPNFANRGLLHLSRGVGTGNDNFAAATAVLAKDLRLPTMSTVFDGSVAGVQTSFNGGSLTNLSANWFDAVDPDSGIAGYEYSIGTSPGLTDTRAWTNNGLATSVTATGLTLELWKKYYFNIRATDAAGYVSTIASSAGQTVQGVLTLTVSSVAAGQSCGDVITDGATTATSLGAMRLDSTLDRAISGQRLGVFTNATNGYKLYASSPQALTTAGGDIIAGVPGTNAAPASWPVAGTAGFGYATSSSTLSGNATRFRTGLWAAFTTKIEEVMTSTAATAAVEEHCVAVSTSSSATTTAGQYSTTVVYTAVAQF